MSDDSSDGEVVGPPPPTIDSTSESLDATQVFLEREQRRNDARAAAKAAEDIAGSSRPEWMLAPPTASSISSLVGDPLALKSRGFAQASRVQSRGEGGTTGEVDNTLWTETPAAKEQRLRDEQEGRRARATDVSSLDEATLLRMQVERKRDATLREAIKEKDPSRSRSLLDIHQASRRKALRDDREMDSSSRSHKRGRSDDRKRSYRSDRQSTSDHTSKGHKQEHKRDQPNSSATKDDRRRDRSRSPRDHGRTSSAMKSDRRRERSRSPRDAGRTSRSSKHSHRHSSDSAHRKSSISSHAKNSSSRDSMHNQPSPMMWDREAALSIGGKLMDEKTKDRTLRDAAGLADRFGSGSRSFL